MDELSQARQNQTIISSSSSSLIKPSSSSLLNQSTSTTRNQHPHRKTFQSLIPLLLSYTKPHDIILDPFSGTNAIIFSAVRLQRYGLGIELYPRGAKW